MAKKKKPKRKKSNSFFPLQINMTGGGIHKLKSEKRQKDKERRDLENDLEDSGY